MYVNETVKRKKTQHIHSFIIRLGNMDFGGMRGAYIEQTKDNVQLFHPS